MQLLMLSRVLFRMLNFWWYPVLFKILNFLWYPEFCSGYLTLWYSEVSLFWWSIDWFRLVSVLHKSWCNDELINLIWACNSETSWIQIRSWCYPEMHSWYAAAEHNVQNLALSNPAMLNTIQRPKRPMKCTLVWCLERIGLPTFIAHYIQTNCRLESLIGILWLIWIEYVNVYKLLTTC